MPTVSIIMNCYNGEKYLKEAIDSVYAQTFKDWEIIFWDNLSTDKSPEIAKGYDKRLRYFRGSEFLPLGAARERAIEKAGGEYIAFLDVDDVWMPEHLRLHISSFQEDTVCVYSNFILKDMTSNKEYTPFNPKREFYSGSVRRVLCKKSFIWLQSVVIKTSALKELKHIFDPELLIAEDLDLLLRLSMKGRFDYIPEPTFIYRMHESNLSISKRHFFAHDFSLLLKKYKDILERPMLKDLARQYLLAVRVDLSQAGFKVFPFFRLGFSPKQILISILYILFTHKNVLELKNIFKKPLDFLYSIFRHFRKQS